MLISLVKLGLQPYQKDILKVFQKMAPRIVLAKERYHSGDKGMDVRTVTLNSMVLR
jgi:hypothetical protein